MVGQGKRIWSPTTGATNFWTMACTVFTSCAGGVEIPVPVTLAIYGLLHLSAFVAALLRKLTSCSHAAAIDEASGALLIPFSLSTPATICAIDGSGFGVLSSTCRMS